MALPTDVVLMNNDRRLVFKVGRLIDEIAVSKTGSRFDPDLWVDALAPLDFASVILVHFLGTWENSGSFVNEAREWWDQHSHLKRAMERTGCIRAAAVLEDAAELAMQIANRYDADQDLTPEQMAERNRINAEADADVSYGKIAAFIREHQSTLLA